MRNLSAAVLATVCIGASGDPSHCPEDMVPTGLDTCIDRFEFPLRKQAPDGRPLLGVSATPSRRDQEMGEVWDAEGLCRKAQKRLCTIAEWVTACKGVNGAPYPWGWNVKRYQPSVPGDLPCNAARPWSAPDWKLVEDRDEEEMVRLDQSETPGSRASCVSASGAYDMVGNAEEWVRCPGRGKDGWCLMGGFWSNPRRCSDSNGAHSGRWYSYQTGLRCCSSEAK